MNVMSTSVGWFDSKLIIFDSGWLFLIKKLVNQKPPSTNWR